MDVLFVVDLSGSNTQKIPDTNINNYDLIRDLIGEIAENLNVASNHTHLAYTPYAQTFGERADKNDLFDNLLIQEITTPDNEKVRNYLNQTMHQNVGSTGKLWPCFFFFFFYKVWFLLDGTN